MLFSEFKKLMLEKDPVAYKLAQRRGLLTELCMKLFNSNGFKHSKKRTLEIASNYKGTDFSRDFDAEYGHAKREKYLDELRKILGIAKRKFVGNYPKHSKQRTLKIASKYKGTSFNRSHQGEYNHARRHGYLDQLVKVLGSERRKNTKKSGHWLIKENCKNEASKYKTRQEWHEKSPASYSVARKKGWADEFIPNLRKSRTKEECAEQANKYCTIKEWEANDPNSCCYARKKGWMKELTKHMVILCPHRPKGFWTKERLQEKALKYNNPTDWYKGDQASYSAALKSGWYKELISHMNNKIKPKGFWNKKTCKQEALKYKSKKDWGRASSRSYMLSLKNGWVDQFCKHMVK
jgi:hypothetical protein